METDIVLFWFLVLTCVSGLTVVTTRMRAAALGWESVYLIILAFVIVGRVLEKSGLIYLSFMMWLLLVVLPSLLSRVCYRHFLQQRYSTARRIARIIGWLHPADGLRQQPEIFRALELAQRGDLNSATETLRRFQATKSVLGLAAITNLYRLTNKWEELFVWLKQHQTELERHSQLLPVLLRAHGENGDLRGMVELYERNKKRIARLVPPASRDLCRLMLFAFCGQRDAVNRLMIGSLSMLPPSTQEFWMATANLTSGEIETARLQFEPLLSTGDPAMRGAIERRLSRLWLQPEPLDAAVRRVIQEAALEQSHDEMFGARRSLFSKHARAIQLLIGLNVAVFVVEVLSGGATNPETLYQLGALFPPAVRAGEWWRLVASLFLHFGLLHLAMNMFALWVLGPFTEFALGFSRCLFVYLLSGIGSMATVMMLASEQLTVGASGCIMGLVGATGALMLRGWLREKAFSARQRLAAMVAILVMQTVFDSMVPQVSMTAHLSGALIGFACTLILRDRLINVAPRGTL